MTPNRRDFLKTSAVGVLGASAFPSPFVHALSKSADAADTRTLVVIYLRGGCDSLNVVVPYHDENYYAIRPTIGIAAPGTTDLPEGERAALPLTRGFGLHPAMQSLMPLWEQKLFAPIINVGSTHPTRSHFDAQDFMEWAAPGIKSIQEGWLNRYLQRTSTPNDHFLRGFSPQPLLPRALRGDYAVLAAPGPGSEVAIDTFAELYECEGKRGGTTVDPATTEEPQTAARGRRGKKEEIPERPPVTEEDLTGRLIDAGANTVTKLRHLNGILRGNEAAKKRYPRGGLGSQLADIAAVIKAGQPIEVAAVDYGGWDHHSYQGGSAGTQARMLKTLSDGIAAFVKDLGPARMKNVLVLTMTEFGRTAAENGNAGSDHGHGGFMLAVGGRVAGGRIHGKWTGLHPSKLNMRRDMPVHTDFRDVFAEALAGLYRFDWKSDDFFPGFDRPARQPLGFLREAEGSRG